MRACAPVPSYAAERVRERVAGGLRFVESRNFRTVPLLLDEAISQGLTFVRHDAALRVAGCPWELRVSGARFLGPALTKSSVVFKPCSTLLSAEGT